MGGAQTGSARLSPVESWTVLTDAPLRGLVLAREAVRIYAWDESDNLYCLDELGRRIWGSRAPGKVIAGAASDDGSLLALLGEGRRLWLYGHDLELREDRETPAEPLALGVDPHGRFVVVSCRSTLNQIYTAHGKISGRFETLQALVSLAFVPGRPLLIGAAGNGSLFGIDLIPSGSLLQAEVAWRQSVLSNVGRLAVTGDGEMILASCFSHGIQRFDASGNSEGAYHLGETVTHAVPDFIGRLIAAATQEGGLSLLNRAGNVRWKTSLARPAVSLELDALGRFLIHGDGSGAITRRNLDGSPARFEGAAEPGGKTVKVTPPRGKGGPPPAQAAPVAQVRQPSWTRPVAKTDDQAETAVLAVLDQPTRIALMTNTGRLTVFDPLGEPIHESDPVPGIGRILRVAPGWIAAATDRHLLLYSAHENRSERLDLRLVELTHLVLRPDTYGLAIVQERDRIGRITIAGRWVWREELDSPVEELAVGSQGTTAVATEDGRLRLYNAAGEPLTARFGPADEPLLILSNRRQDEPGPVWFTLARHEQVVRGHALDGTIAWELPVPWVSWQFLEVGDYLLIASPDGKALAVDTSGQVVARREEETPPGVYGPGADGLPCVLTLQGPNLVCSSLGGRILWRSLIPPGRAPMALGQTGAAVMIARSLAWYPASVSVKSEASDALLD